MNPQQKTPDEQANDWLARLDSPSATPEDRLAFQVWLAESAVHRTAWSKARAFWQKFDALQPEQIALLERRLNVGKKPRRPTPWAPSTARRFFNAWPVPVFASLLLAVWLGGGTWPLYFADYRTATGEQKSLQLSDGSTMILNTETAVSVDMSPTRRTVTLHRGEAFFKVAKAEGRPFEVQTHHGSVRALGTAFDVKHQGEEIAVTVYEHAVRVAFDQGSTVERLQEGERVMLTKGQMTPIEAVNLKRSRAWLDHRLIFKDQPLAQVVAELNRYRKGKILILDSTLEQHRVTGIFDTREADKAINVIADTLHLTDYRLPGSLVLLVGR